jgi:hypothetical protein
MCPKKSPRKQRPDWLEPSHIPASLPSSSMAGTGTSSADGSQITEPKCPFCLKAMRTLTRGPFLKSWRCDACRVGISREYGDWNGEKK